MNKMMNLKGILGEEKSREEVMREICKNTPVYYEFLDW